MGRKKKTKKKIKKTNKKVSVPAKKINKNDAFKKLSELRLR